MCITALFLGPVSQGDHPDSQAAESGAFALHKTNSLCGVEPLGAEMMPLV